jgi:hypothetical protein
MMAFAGGAEHGLAYALPHMGFANFFTHDANRAFVDQVSWARDRSKLYFDPEITPF